MIQTRNAETDILVDVCYHEDIRDNLSKTKCMDLPYLGSGHSNFWM